MPDVVVRFAARFTDRSLREITPALGRRSRHTTEKARRLLGWSLCPEPHTTLTRRPDELACLKREMGSP